MDKTVDLSHDRDVKPHCLGRSTGPGAARRWASPWPMYAALRDRDPVHHVVPEGRPDEDYYVLTRHEDVLRAAVDTATYSSRQGLTVTTTSSTRSAWPTTRRWSCSTRRSTRRSASWSPAGSRRGRCARSSRRCGPTSATSSTRSSPPAAATSWWTCSSRSRAWSSRTTSASPPRTATGSTAGPTRSWRRAPRAEPTDAAEATTQMLGYFSELIDRRRREPGDDTISHLVAAGVGDDDAGLLSILGYVFAMVTGGNDTTTGALGGAVQLLAERPDQREGWSADPTRVRGAVEEFLRLTSPVQALARTTTRDVELHGVTDPGRPQGAALLRRGQPRPAQVRPGRRGARRPRAARPSSSPSARAATTASATPRPG